MGVHGIVATAVLETARGASLATAVARGVAVQGRAIALCRPNHEIFGFVIPDRQDPNRYYLNHRTGTTLLMLQGNFDEPDAVGINPAKSQVCWFGKMGDKVMIGVVPMVDIGLVMCGLVAVRIHKKLIAVANDLSQEP